jgi:hypothetical protein
LARIVEGYPKAASKLGPDAFVWTGVEAAYAKVGFEEAARRSPTKPVMRFRIEERAAIARKPKGRGSP